MEPICAYCGETIWGAHATLATGHVACAECADPDTGITTCLQD